MRTIIITRYAIKQPLFSPRYLVINYRKTVKWTITEESAGDRIGSHIKRWRVLAAHSVVRVCRVFLWFPRFPVHLENPFGKSLGSRLLQDTRRTDRETFKVSKSWLLSFRINIREIFFLERRRRLSLGKVGVCGGSLMRSYKLGVLIENFLEIYKNSVSVGLSGKFVYDNWRKRKILGFRIK